MPGVAPDLLLLGVGWNEGRIAGSTLPAVAAPGTLRPRVEGAGEPSTGADHLTSPRRISRRSAADR